MDWDYIGEVVEGCRENSSKDFMSCIEFIEKNEDFLYVVYVENQ